MTKANELGKVVDLREDNCNVEYVSEEEWKELEEEEIEEIDMIPYLVDACKLLTLKEFASVVRGIIQMYGDIHGISIGKILDAMILNEYYDGDPYMEMEEQLDSKTTS